MNLNAIQARYLEKITCMTIAQKWGAFATLEHSIAADSVVILPPRLSLDEK